MVFKQAWQELKSMFHAAFNWAEKKTDSAVLTQRNRRGTFLRLLLAVVFIASVSAAAGYWYGSRNALANYYSTFSFVENSYKG